MNDCIAKFEALDARDKALLKNFRLYTSISRMKELLSEHEGNNDVQAFLRYEIERAEMLEEERKVALRNMKGAHHG